MIPAGTVIYATGNDDAGLADARAWIKAQGLTADTCKLARRDIDGVTMLIVVALVDGLDLKVTHGEK
jgi:hypothetical protein